MSKEIDNVRLGQIAERIAAKIPELIGEADKQLLEDYAYAVNDAHEKAKEKLPSLKMTFTAEFSPGDNTLDTSMTWTVKRTIEDSERLEDPEQPEFDATKAAIGRKPRL